jgi:hypothetical protein
MNKILSHLFMAFSLFICMLVPLYSANKQQRTSNYYFYFKLNLVYHEIKGIQPRIHFHALQKPILN